MRPNNSALAPRMAATARGRPIATPQRAALGHAVGLCDLTRGELATNGTPEQRVLEAEEARRVLGAAWRENLGLPDRAIGASPESCQTTSRPPGLRLAAQPGLTDN